MAENKNGVPPAPPVNNPNAPTLLVGVFQMPDGSISVMWNGITPQAAVRKLVNAAEDMRDFLYQPKGEQRVITPPLILGRGPFGGG